MAVLHFGVLSAILTNYMLYLCGKWRRLKHLHRSLLAKEDSRLRLIPPYHFFGAADNNRTLIKDTTPIYLRYTMYSLNQEHSIS